MKTAKYVGEPRKTGMIIIEEWWKATVWTDRRIEKETLIITLRRIRQ